MIHNLRASISRLPDKQLLEMLASAQDCVPEAVNMVQEEIVLRGGLETLRARVEVHEVSAREEELAEKNHREERARESSLGPLDGSLLIGCMQAIGVSLALFVVAALVMVGLAKLTPWRPDQDFGKKLALATMSLCMVLTALFARHRRKKLKREAIPTAAVAGDAHDSPGSNRESGGQ